MSHTFDGKHTRFHYNSDLSGEVEIVKKDSTPRRRLHVHGEDLLAFVAEYVRGKAISRIEDMSVEELLDR